MALTVKETAVIALIGSATAQSHGAINEGCRKAVRKAYSDVDDAGEFAREVFAAVKDIYKDGVARFFRRHGLNVTLSGTRNTLSVIGGALDRSKQDAVFKKLDEDTAIQGEIKQHAPKGEKVLAGFAADRAKAYLAKAVKRLKAADPDAGAYLNDVVAKADVAPSVNPFAGMDLSAAEVKACQDFITMMRLEPAFDDEVVEVIEIQPLAIAA